jgi:acetylornithine/N-succinyldiaminopimelate aminotransferase
MGAVVEANPHVYRLRRGAGLMQGVMIADPHTCGEVVARLRDEHHLLTVPAGQNVIRLLPPLIVSDAEIDQAVSAFAAVAAAMKS